MTSPQWRGQCALLDDEANDIAANCGCKSGGVNSMSLHWVQKYSLRTRRCPLIVPGQSVTCIIVSSLKLYNDRKLLKAASSYNLHSCPLGTFSRPRSHRFAKERCKAEGRWLKLTRSNRDIPTIRFRQSSPLIGVEMLSSQ